MAVQADAPMRSLWHHLLIVEDDPETGSHLVELVGSIAMTARLVATFGGFSILQRSDAGLWLHPLVSVAPIAWEAFERDSNPGIQAVAAAERKRR